MLLKFSSSIKEDFNFGPIQRLILRLIFGLIFRMIIKTIVKEIYLNNNQIRRVKFKGNILFPNLTDIDLRYHVITWSNWPSCSIILCTLYNFN